LLRHGIAVPHGTPGVDEDDRPLTAKGEDRVTVIGRALDRLGVKSEAVVTSPLPRARRTAELVAKALDLDDRVEEQDVLLPGSTPASVRKWLRSRNEDSLMLVGHNPNLSDLAALLLGFPKGSPPLELKKGGFAELSLVEEGRYQLEWLATPKLLRKVRG
jgi:phosphohistidine phosphatase